MIVKNDKEIHDCFHPYEVNVPHKVPEDGPSRKFFFAHARHYFGFSGLLVRDFLCQLWLGGSLSHCRKGVLETHREFVEKFEIRGGLSGQLGRRTRSLLVVIPI